MRNEEAASGVDCEECELNNILQNLKEETEEEAETYNKQKKPVRPGRKDKSQG